LENPITAPVSTGMSAEGDINLTPNRAAWTEANISPASQRVIERDSRYFLRQSLSTPVMNVISRSHGIFLEDAQGRLIMDFHGNSVHQVGYGHPHVIESVKSALDSLPFSPRRYTNSIATDFARRLVEMTPEPLAKVLIAPGGAEAMGIALKIARLATGRHKTISMWDAFHGASLDTISIGGEALFRKGIGPLMSGTEHAPPCDPGRCLFGCGGACTSKCADYIEYILAKEEDVAAVIVETVRSTDVQVPPPLYYRKLREACDRHGALLIMDEIPICLGRTGRMYAFEHYGIVPDMVVLGKGLGGAVFPMAAIVARPELDIAADRALGHYTHEKSSVGCAAALATLEVIEAEGLCERSTVLGEYALERLQELKSRHPFIGEVRGLGLLLGVELVKDGEPAHEEAERVMYACLSRGLSFKVGQGNVIVLSPPLIIPKEALDHAINILDDSLREIEAD